MRLKFFLLKQAKKLSLTNLGILRKKEIQQNFSGVESTPGYFSGKLQE